MLEEPGRYVYSALPERPALSLPGGARVAVWVAPNHEFYELDPPLGGTRRPWPRVQPDTLAYSHRDFGNRVGIWRVIDVLERLGVKGSISLNVALCDHHPETAERCADLGWEFFSHGIYNTRYLFEMSEQDERRVIEDVIETIGRYSGQKPAGWLSPALSNTERTLDLLAEYGFTYTCDLFHDDQPFPVKVKEGRLISIPYSLELNDLIAYISYQASPEEYGRMIRRALDWLHAEAERNDTAYVMGIPLHPYLVGQAHRLRHFEEALEYVVNHRGVWVSTGREIAQHYLDHHYDNVAGAVGHEKAVSR